MSAATMTACDGCGNVAQGDWSEVGAYHGWLHVLGSVGNRQRDRGIDACSWACLATVVAQHVAEQMGAEGTHRDAEGHG